MPCLLTQRDNKHHKKIFILQLQNGDFFVFCIKIVKNS